MYNLNFNDWYVDERDANFYSEKISLNRLFLEIFQFSASDVFAIKLFMWYFEANSIWN